MKKGLLSLFVLFLIIACQSNIEVTQKEKLLNFDHHSNSPKVLKETFDLHEIGEYLEEYQWIRALGSTIEVTDEMAFLQRQGIKDQKSLKVSSINNPTNGYDFTGVKFCTQRGEESRFIAKFQILFRNFAHRATIAVTDSPDLAYWWYIKDDGSFTDGNTLSALPLNEWIEIQIDINRKQGFAQLLINDTKFETPLDNWWILDEQPTSNMGCLRFLTAEGKAQTFFLDSMEIYSLN